MRRLLALALTLLLIAESVPAATSVSSEIASMPPGTALEVHLKNKQKRRGLLGPVTDSGFGLRDKRGGEEHLAFDDVASVKQVSAKSHVKRNVILIVVAGVAVVALVIGLQLRCGPFGCGKAAPI